MITEHRGNLLEADTEALVNTVNTLGVMGKGIALQFKRAFPANYDAYKRAADDGMLRIGRVFVWDAGSQPDVGPRYILNFPTKQHWRSRSKLEFIEAGLLDLAGIIEDLGIKSVAVPPLGCGQGGLEWAVVRTSIIAALAPLDDVEVRLYLPNGSPAPKEQIVRTPRPAMTPARAALIGMLAKFLPHALSVTAVDIQKLTYFLQVAGEPLGLDYRRGRYGPYSDDLRRLLAFMEGHFFHGMGDGTALALDTLPFELHAEAEREALDLLEVSTDTKARFERVTRLIEGFESTYGLELLATVHWAATTTGRPDPSGSISVDDDLISDTVRSWNDRKGRIYTPRHVALALERLRALEWVTETGRPSFGIA